MLLPNAVPYLEGIMGLSSFPGASSIGSEASMTCKMLSCSLMHLNHAGRPWSERKRSGCRWGKRNRIQQEDEKNLWSLMHSMVGTITDRPHMSQLKDKRPLCEVMGVSYSMVGVTLSIYHRTLLCILQMCTFLSGVAQRQVNVGMMWGWTE